MKKIIVRSRQNVFRHETEILVGRYGFQEINNGETSKGIKTRKELILFFLSDVLFVIRNIKKISHADVIVVTGFNALTIKLLIKLGIIKYKKLLWFGFFIHSDLAHKIFKVVLNALSLKHEVMVLNSMYEIPLYAERLGIPERKLAYLKLGDWKNPVELFDPDYVPPFEDYFFAGGFTNRNYKTLIEAFRHIDKNLIIVGSQLNEDLKSLEHIPSNIIIKKDIDKTEFESLVVHSKVCILPMKDPDAGASGHMVLLAYMRHKKPILASNFPAIREYIVNNKSGILYDDPENDIPKIIEKIDRGEYDLNCFVEEAFKAYEEEFNAKALEENLIKIVESNL
ncbi:glycosyltransferase involved in cell wall biosynthesis [Catalinimonas alkaloidigena]|uniref:glycosyltransferase n=1 Tax=Catalinimonas alkaloidigena TaxID=1075417 RepID=UPI002406FB00|nr:glycosyltransferase [Catalinimonas alkaloidigena]MDF9796743.1 glycosyltransferase involved in cell wall biosynthesis [Catalinimonas alkaloidigena]